MMNLLMTLFELFIYQLMSLFEIFTFDYFLCHILQNLKFVPFQYMEISFVYIQVRIHYHFIIFMKCHFMMIYHFIMFNYNLIYLHLE